MSDLAKTMEEAIKEIFLPVWNDIKNGVPSKPTDGEKLSTLNKPDLDKEAESTPETEPVLEPTEICNTIAEELLFAQILEVDTENHTFSLQLKNGEVRNYQLQGKGKGFVYNKFDISKTTNEKTPLISGIVCTRRYKDYDGDSLQISFFGKHKKIAEIDCVSFSDFGCHASVTLKCHETNEEWILTYD